ncbi:MAG: hypothetical protein M3126_05770 [Candidatus Eremiobacteraeota bacterium]|nr:hypothetical protein [Candidatus Eremiobacteraeota bacterium]
MSGQSKFGILQRAHNRLQNDRAELSRQVVALLIERRKVRLEDHEASTALDAKIEELNRKIKAANEAAQDFFVRLTNL